MNGQRSLIWARCADQTQADHAKALSERLESDGDMVQILATLPKGQAGGSAQEHPQGARAVAAFLGQCQPKLALWIGGVLDSTTLGACHAASVPVIVVNATPKMLEGLRSSWIPGKQRQSAMMIHSVLASDRKSVEEFLKAGVARVRIQETGPFEDAGHVLPHHEAERQELAKVIGTRPIWLAAGISVAEAPIIADAMRLAARRAHRLLTIVTPANPRETAALAAFFRDAGLVTGLRFDGDEPDEATNVYVGEGAEELGLWYRIAPISFIGGSFDKGATDNPFHAAALGSVVVHGPAYGPFKGRFQRLLDADASCEVKDPEGLGAAVSALLSADKAARHATAGWDVTSRGAEVGDRVVALIQGLLDRATP